jgi:TonB family protein
MTFLGLAAAWSLQILAIGAAAEACSPVVQKLHPRLRAWFWSAALLLSLSAPWLLSPSSGIAPAQSDGLFVVSSAVVARTVSAITPSFQDALFAVWLVVAAVLVARLGRGLHRLAVITRDSKPVAMPERPDLRVRENTVIASPAASFLGSVVLVPSTFKDLPKAWKNAALEHEAIHLSRGHGLLLALEETLLALFWFHPMMFRLVSRVRDSREEMVDAATIEAVGGSEGYREMLVSLASRMTIPAPAVSGTTALSARIESLITLEKTPMTPNSRLRLLIPGLVLVTTAALASTAAPIAGPQDKTKVDARKEGAPPRKVVSKVNPEYPPALKEKKVAGVVQVTVVIDKDGVVTSAKGSRPGDNPELVKVAIDAVRQWRYEPGQGSATMTHTFQFKLDDDKEKK